MRIFYLPIEPYQERYTALLASWTLERWQKKNEVIVVQGDMTPGAVIKNGAVLDAHSRSRYALSQMANLINLLSAYGANREDIIYFDDMFTPGIEALPYIFDQLDKKSRPGVFVRNHAQSVDPDDFTFKMRHWMRHFEHLVYNVVDGVICASSVHKEMMEIAGLPTERVYVLGLPFSTPSIQSFVGAQPFDRAKPMRVIYSSRLDSEKQPHFFLNLVERFKGEGVEFVISTGSQELRSNDPSVLKRIEDLCKTPLLQVYKGATKNTYYGLLASARVQLNTARQDFISYTAIEASALGTATLAPAFRSFPEALQNNPRHTYIPWSLDDAESKLRSLLDTPVGDGGWLAHKQNETLDRILQLFKCHQNSQPFLQPPWWEA